RRLRHYPRMQTYILEQLIEALRQVWHQIPQAAIRRCINMQQRLRDVIFNRGSNTSY
ncbi:hypothetical protein ALC60_01415, partial [Trachymyrmex zeteki]